jgi:antirestriction protein ArdC
MPASILSHRAERRHAGDRHGNYERITGAIQAALTGEVPRWRRPWRTLRENGVATTPRNAITGRGYRGVNACLLWGRQDADMQFLTYRQAAGHGGHVRKGEHGTQVVFWEKRTYQTRDETGEEEIRDGLLMRVYTVFHISQCEGVKLPKASKVSPVPPPVVILDAFANLGAVVDHGGDRAAFIPSHDKIILPRPEAFSSPDAYTATALHELVHWSGHPARLNREFGKRFGDRAYAAEELVAEIGSAFLCAELGVNSALEHHASYVKNWQQLLAADSRAIVTAASKAQAAADYILARIRPASAAGPADESAEAEVA